MKEKERVREEQKKQKKIEHSFKSLLKKLECNENSKFEDIKEKIQNEESYELLQSDSERERLFNEYIKQLQETCLHHVKRKKKDKKKKRSRSSSANSTDDGENEKHSEIQNNVKSDSRSPTKDEIAKEVSENEGEIESDDESLQQEATSKKSKKHKKIKKRKKHKSVSVVV